MTVLNSYRFSIDFLISATQRKTYIWWLAVLVILGSRLIFLNFAPFNHDNGYYLYSSRLLASGLPLYENFIDTNPPFVMYFGVPAIWLAKLLSISETSGFYLYLIIIIFFVLILIWKQVGEIFDREDLMIKGTIFLIFVDALLNPPIDKVPFFGQRPHLLLILMMPYVLSTIIRLSGKPVRTISSVIIGALAAFGVMFAPYFVLSIILLEGYLAWRKKSLFYWIRVEFLVFFFILVSYNILIFIYFHEYYHWAHIALLTTWVYNPPRWMAKVKFLNNGFFIVAAVFASIFVAPRKYKEIHVVFLLVAFSFFMPPLVYRKFFIYHFIPYTSLCLIICALALLMAIIQIQAEGLWRKGAVLLLVIMPLYNYVAALDGMGRYARKLEENPAFHMTRVFDDRADGKPVYALMTDWQPIFPAVNFSGVRMAARFGVLWPLPGFLRNRLLGTYRGEDGKDRLRLGPMTKEEEDFRRTIVEDLIRRQPKLVFVSTGEEHLGLGDLPFDFIEYFSEDPDFKRFWEKFERLPVEIENEDFMYTLYEAKES